MSLKERYECLRKVVAKLDDEARGCTLGSEHFLAVAQQLVEERGKLIVCMKLLAHTRKGGGQDALNI